MLFFIFISILATMDTSAGITCFKCSVATEISIRNNRTITTPSCLGFDESDDFQVDCPYSTMCLKTISSLVLLAGETQETITRGCASQKETTQVFLNRQWQQKHLVQEVYTEGCESVKNNQRTGSKQIHCYCRGNLCNNSVRNFSKLFTILPIPLIWFTKAFPLSGI